VSQRPAIQAVEWHCNSKEEKPTLKGASVKQRKRNIQVPLDPGAFAIEVLTVFEGHSEGESVEEKLESAIKTLDTTDLDFWRYGETLFEILFAGKRMAAGANLVTDRGKELKTNVSLALCSRSTRELLEATSISAGQKSNPPVY